MMDVFKAVAAFIFNTEIFPSILIFSASIFGLKKITMELRFRSIMAGMTEKIDRIHRKNEILEEYCAKNISYFLENYREENQFETLKPQEVRKIDTTVRQLLSKSIGCSRQLETYSLFAKHCFSKENIINNENKQGRKYEIYNALINTLDIIQKQALTIIESPGKMKLKQGSLLKPDLRLFTSSKGFNSTPNVEVGPSANDSTDEATYFYAVCLRQNINFNNSSIFLAFFEIIRRNHPFCILMQNGKILPPTKIKIKHKGGLLDETIYHAINFKEVTWLGSGKKTIEVIYANISRGIELDLSNKDPDKILSEIELGGAPIDFGKEKVIDCHKLENKHIVLKFEKETLAQEFKRNRRGLELELLKNANKLNIWTKSRIFFVNFFRFKC